MPDTEKDGRSFMQEFLVVIKKEGRERYKERYQKKVRKKKMGERKNKTEERIRFFLQIIVNNRTCSKGFAG